MVSSVFDSSFWEVLSWWSRTVSRGRRVDASVDDLDRDDRSSSALRVVDRPRGRAGEPARLDRHVDLARLVEAEVEDVAPLRPPQRQHGLERDEQHVEDDGSAERAEEELRVHLAPDCRRADGGEHERERSGAGEKQPQ